MKENSKIPSQFKMDGFRMVKVDGKKPVGKAWNKPENAFKYNDEVLLAWIEKNNYGILHGCGSLIALDADNFPRWQELDLDKFFEDTFTVQTGRVDANGNRTGKHFYLICQDLTDKLIEEFGIKSYYKLVDSNGTDIGELRLHHCQTVGPNSIHPSGNRYEIINDVEIKVISIWDLLDIFEPYIGKKEITWRIPENGAKGMPKDYSTIEHLDLNVENLANLHDFWRHGEEYQGPHPVHG